MDEFFLHHIWKFRLFNHEGLKTVNDEVVQINHVGFHNHDAGPDFFNAQIIINEIKWAGNVEIHINSSDWNKHRHSEDAAYDNIILHVVFNHDCKLMDRFGNEIPTLELKNRMDQNSYLRYQNFIEQQIPIPCANHIRDLDRLVLFQQLDKCFVNRLERKIQPIQELLRSNNFHWEQTAFIFLAKNFGFVTNAIPFECIAMNTPFELIKRCKGNLPLIESLIFGQAGMLRSDSKSEYIQGMIQDYKFLKEKNKLKGIKSSQWKFSRMRPMAFPSIRLAQFAVLLNEYESIMNLFFSVADDPSSYRKLRVCASSFWDHHYSFKVPSPIKAKVLGDDAIHNLMINTIAPLIFCYGKLMSEDRFMEQASKMLEFIKAEKNNIVRTWHNFGLVATNAAESQAIIELNNEWCLKKKCLTCSIGTKILYTHDDKNVKLF